ncbi:hypothetical protein L227DRAFT_562857 [Lentinus tigrinus ALCF2SS1-6]|uniref:Uncharacterized protein n=1 Tax=Lentinus tigrinus ALCF2SS1-6 TaxID=1328759 RepID=A0A5C2SDS0_9APHY|nr:hypothetical protein L227DRAFT_562857 [Lentinus tigrinus ALCF2SS1-6]
MSAQPGHASNLASGNPNARLHTNGQGGRPRTMILGMATVAAGLGMFWLVQFKKQNRSHTSPDPAEMPTWQFRHAQQAPEFNARVSTPGGTSTNVRSSKEPTQYKVATPADTKDTSSGGGVASSGMVQARAPSDGGHELGGNRSGSRGGEGSAVDPRGKDNHAPKRGDGSHDQGIVASILTSIQGDPRKGTQDSNGHVGQPAPVQRQNDRGAVYTKNTDFVDGYKRD